MLLDWITDLHIDTQERLDSNEVNNFFSNLTGDAILITGDISQKGFSTTVLETIQAITNKPVYFVLGNHDLWHIGDWDLKFGLVQMTTKNPNIHNIGDSTVGILLDLPLLGANNWYDGYYGNTNTNTKLNDFRNIPEMASESHNRGTLVSFIREKSRQAVKRLQYNVAKLLERYSYTRISIAMHIPPFQECAMVDDDRLPYYTSALMGMYLDEISELHPEVQFDVYCGHTHSPCVYQRSANLTVYVGVGSQDTLQLAGQIQI